jgi:hypothetical protein
MTKQALLSSSVVVTMRLLVLLPGHRPAEASMVGGTVTIRLAHEHGKWATEVMVVRSGTGDAGALVDGLEFDVDGDRITISLVRDYTTAFPFPVTLVVEGVPKRIAAVSLTDAGGIIVDSEAAIDAARLSSTNNSVTIDLGRVITAGEEE